MKWREQMRRWRKLLGASEAAEIAEVAMVLPLVILILLAILWFGRAFNIYSTITDAAREGAKVMVAQKCATCPVSAPTVADVKNRVDQVLQAAHIDPTQEAAYAPNPLPVTGSCIGAGSSPAAGDQVSVYTNVQLNGASSGPPACGVVVSFQYPFTFFLFNPGPPYGRNSFVLHLKAVAQMQGEN